MSTQPQASQIRAESLGAFLPLVKPRIFRRKDLIYACGSRNAYWLLEGIVTVSRVLPTGKVMNVGHYGPSEIFGESSLFPYRAATEYATAIEDVSVMSWPADQFSAMLAAKSGMWAVFGQIMIDRQCASAMRIEGLLGFNTGALVRALLDLSRIGTPNSGGMVMLPMVSHGSLAHDIGTTREIVTATLGNLRKSGAVSFERFGRKISVHPNRLRGLLKSETQGGSK